MMREFGKDEIEAMAEVVRHMIWLMETSDPELIPHAMKMKREMQDAIRRLCMGTLANLNAEAAIRLHNRGHLDFECMA